MDISQRMNERLKETEITILKKKYEFYEDFKTKFYKRRS